MAARVIDLLLAHSITAAVTGGSCVAATGLGDTRSTLALAAQELTESRMRVLQLRPPFDDRPFAEQFATAWCESSLPGGGQAVAAGKAVAALPTAASEPFAVLVHDAHLLPHETLRHLDRMARTWGCMRLAFAGGPEFVHMLEADDLPTLRSKVTSFVNVPARRPGAGQFGTPTPRRPSLAELAAAEADGAADWSGRPSIPPAITAAATPATLREARNGAVTVVAGLVAAAAVVWLAAVPSAVPRLRAFVAGQDEDRPAASWQTHAAMPSSPAELGSVKTAELEPDPQAAPSLAKASLAEPVSAANSPQPDPAPHPEPAAALVPAAVESEPDAANHASPAAEATEAQEPVPEPSPDKLGSADNAAPPSDPGDSEPPVDSRAATEVEPPPSADAPATAPVAAPVAAVHPPQPAQPEAAPATPPQPVVSEPPSQPVVVAPQPQPAVAASPPPAASSLSPAMADAMVRRGRTMLEQGNVSAARLLFGRAAEAGYGPAARAMGATFDAAPLEQVGVFGITPDPKQAAGWYQRALALGDAEARVPLEALNNSGGPSAAQAKVNQ